MGFLSRVFGKAVSSPVGTDPRGWSLLNGQWPARWHKADELFSVPTLESMEEAYSHPIVRACVDEITTSLAEPRLEIGMEVDGEWESVDHPLLDLVESPNPYNSGTDLILAWTMRMELTGVGYLLKLRTASKSIAQLWPIPSSWVLPIRGTGTQLVKEYKIRGQKKVFAENDLCACKHLDPASIDGYCGPYQASQHDHALDVEREEYLAEMLLNLKVPGMTIINKAGFRDAEKRKQAKKDIRDAIGRGNRGEPLLLEGDTTVQMNNPLGDLDWPNFAGSIEARICMAFGVPPIIIGSRFGLTRSTYANYEQARESFYKETLRPKWVRIGDALTRSLLRNEGEPLLRVRFRFDEMPEFQEDLDAKSVRVVSLFRGGIITKQEARSEMGYDPEADGEFYTAPDPLLGTETEEDEDEDEEEKEDVDTEGGADDTAM